MNEEQEPLRISRNANNVNRAKTNLNQIKPSQIFIPEKLKMAIDSR